ncbi:MAG: M24 family metallopeptidase, partial [Candidatus Poseidoniaceae archaeon]|nr:M24 family metallopeptidase [Candidatus Poseidoniaceae archaeon]
DSKARKYLKQIGLNYSHGTGHGVGYFLNVHEGPQSISKNNKIQFEDSSLFEHFLSADLGDQIALLSSTLHICAKMDAHLQEVMEEEVASMEDYLSEIAEILKESDPDSN